MVPLLAKLDITETLWLSHDAGKAAEKDTRLADLS